MSVRKHVFIQEQGVSEADEWDVWDAISQHVVVLDANRDAVATGRLQGDGKITRMAVLPAHRGSGVGAALLELLISMASDSGHVAWLHAQTQVQDFYRKFGFVAEGERFDEAGIEHVLMRLNASPPDP
ncbi:MAG: GNAT family N-acetyltransferase [Pseudomonadota bacterium]